VGNWLLDHLADVLLLGGAAAVTYGAALIYPQAGWIVGGLLALGAGWRLGRSQNEVKRG